MAIHCPGVRAGLGLALLATMSLAHADVFINEIHYDNDGTDVGEKVEVAAPAGTSLAGWSVVLYNGSGGSRYATLSLSGTVADQCGGWGTAVVDASGMQNGAPDGLALVDAGGNVVQLLSYEGSFTASDGPAAGMASQNIGVSESTTTPAGQSLRLAGSGATAADFAWQAPATASFGACNAGQSFTGGNTGGGGTGGGSSTLANGVPVTGLAAATGDSVAYTFAVASGASNLAVSISGGTGDADLYLRFGAAPTTSSYDCRPYKNGNSESCSVASPQAGTWYVMVRAYSSYSGVTLGASWTEASGGGGSTPPPSGNVLENGVAVGNLAASTGNTLDYTMEVPAGATDLSFVTAGGSGDADLYVRFGSAPTTSSYDCRPYANGNAETCSFASPQAGTWYVSLRAYKSFSGVSLTGSYTAPSGGGGGGTTDPGTYYASVDASNPSVLRSTLHAAINQQTKIPYTASTTDTWDVLDQAEQDPLDPSRVLDIYKNQSYAKAGGGNTNYNREHTWPKSYGFPTDGPDNYCYTDLHMLMAANIDYNSARGNLPFGDCDASCTEYPTDAYAGRGGGSGVFPGNSNWSNGVIWQVWTRLQGDVARAVLYMDVRYEGGNNPYSGISEPDLILTDDMSKVVMTGGNASVAYMGRLTTLLNWAANDPVDENERLRNELVYSYQGNRNPFVDHPEWIDCIFKSLCN